MTHETFASISVSVDVERAWFDDQLDELEDYSRAQGVTGKRIASAVRTLEGRIEKLRDRTSDADSITFEQLGIDYLAADEADRLRRLPITTRAEGFSMGTSKRATDLLLKMSMLRRANPTRPHAAMFTGTPWTNTLAEAYVWQRFCAPERLAETGLGHFDAWAAPVRALRDVGGGRPRWLGLPQQAPARRGPRTQCRSHPPRFRKEQCAT
jgi:N12 class adenine-specific DNA methylase